MKLRINTIRLVGGEVYRQDKLIDINFIYYSDIFLSLKAIRPYLLNGFLLTIPVITWNMLVAGYLPEIFQPEVFEKDIPRVILYGENGSRILFFLLIFLMPIQRQAPHRKAGWILYCLGLCLYILSWLLQLYFPESNWSKSLPGLSAPAWTPALWMSGIILVTDTFSFQLPYRRWIALSAGGLFLLFHNIHTLIILMR